MSVTVAAGRHALETLRLAHQLESTGTTPTPEQARMLASWTGWGILAPAFSPQPTGSWADMRDELVELLDAERFHEAATSLDVSYFTPGAVVDAVWALLAAAGFTGGRVLEPGCGTGAMVAGAPAGLELDFHGIERDTTSAVIASLLHPDARITHKALQDVHLRAGSYDAVIGNFPFSSESVYDSAGVSASSLHEYFLRRSLAALRPGGYLVAITSGRFMEGAQFSRIAADGGQVVSVIRLPEEAFAETGATVVSDILIIRKAPAGEYGQVPSADPFSIPDAPRASLHGWWAAHPELVVGEFVATSFYQRPVTVRCSDVAPALEAALEATCAMIAEAPMTAGQVIPPLDLAEVSVQGFKEGSFQIIEATEDSAEQIVRVVDGVAEMVARPSKRLRALIGLRDKACALLEAEAVTTTPDSELIPLRFAARQAYQDYRTLFGPINHGTLHEGKVDPDTGLPALSWRPVKLGGFRTDPDFHLVAALEVYDQETGTAEPAPILVRRINRAPEPVTSADTPAEALAICLGETGELDLERIGELLGIDSEERTVAALGDLVYADPAHRHSWVTARDYLSGNVRAKLSEAVAAAKTDPAYRRNVAALEAVVPSDLGPADIRVSLGVPWVLAEDYRNFAKDVLGADYLTVEHSPETAAWDVDGRVKYSHAAVTEFGVPSMDPLKLLSLGMNNKVPVVKVYDFDQDREVRDPAATAAAQEKLEAIRTAFSAWIWEDPERSERLCAEYNRRFRSYVARAADGSYLRFPTMSNALTPYWWQYNIVDRIISTPAVLCGHTVGAGKTLSMAMSAVALRQFGLANKPLIVVPNHLLEQISREMAQAFPLGKFLVATKEDLAKDRRRAFAARAATGDWDAIVMTHGAFTSLPVHPEVEKAWLQSQVEELKWSMYASSRMSNFSSKQISKKLRTYEAKLAGLRSDARTDESQVFFEQLGVDWIGVDEAHYMKRLDVGSRLEGFSLGASKRATDLMLKVSWLRENRPGKPILGLFTGTPLTNSLVEIYVWQKFIQPEVLAAAGIEDFNAWAANFVAFSSVVEVAPEGGSFRTKTRPVSILNVPELHAMFSLNADLLTAEDINLERPDADVRQAAVEQAPGQREFTEHLVVRAEKLRNSSAARESDNMLAVVGDGRRAALDQRLVGVDEDSPKLAAVAAEVARLHAEHAHRTYGDSTVSGALQLIFCDQGTPHQDKGAQTYGRLRAQLIKAGVPESGIRWIHEATDDKSRAALFSACRDGSVSVLIGSTEKMGTGTNVQRRLVSVHHADAPWRPSDIEQRDGRALRPGNLNELVEIHRYVVQGTFDVYQWQVLETKAKSFAAMTGAADPTVRELADISEVAPSYTQMKALAAGDPLLLRQAEVADLVSRLMNLRAIDRQALNAARKEITVHERSADHARHKAEQITVALRQLSTPTEEQTHALDDLLGWVRSCMVAAPGSRYSRPSDHSRSHPYGSLKLEARMAADGARTVRLSLAAGYYGLISEELDIKKLGRDPQKVAAKARQVAARLFERLPDRRDSLLADVAHHTERARAAQEMVDNYSFARQEELDAARDELARIDRALEYAAEEVAA